MSALPRRFDSPTGAPAGSEDAGSTARPARGRGESSGPAGTLDRIAVLALGLLAVAASLFSVRATDLFWHLATGRYMVEHLALPRHDPFRFGAGGGLPWVDHEWLFQLLVHAVERLGGLDALVALRVGLVLALAGLLYAAVRRTGGGVAAAVALAALALVGARPRFLIRPELCTFLALAIELHLLRCLVSAGGAAPRRRFLIALMALTVLWANLHGLALLAPVVAFGYLLGAALQPVDHGAGCWRRALLTPVGLAAALAVNPYGLGVFAVAPGITGALTDLAAINPEWLPVWRAPQPLIFAMLFAGFAALAVLVADTARRTRRVHLPAAFVAAGLAALALTAVRHQALFFVTGLFLAAETLALRRTAGAPAPPERDLPAGSALTLVGATLLCLLLATWCLFPPASGPLAPRQGRFELSRGLAPHRFPVAAADWLERHPDIGPLYNELAHGGYLLWRLYPPRQVFLDGRMELEPALLREIEAARSDAGSWQRFLRHRGAAGALVRYEDRARPVFAIDPATSKPVVVARQTPNAVLFPPDLWALVYWDDDVMLFLDRALAANRPFLTHSYAIQPEDTAATLARAGDDPRYRAQALADVERRLAEDPALLRAAWLRERLRELGDSTATAAELPGGPP